jgi:hypothetical protein
VAEWLMCGIDAAELLLFSLPESSDSESVWLSAKVVSSDVSSACWKMPISVPSDESDPIDGRMTKWGGSGGWASFVGV